jgi:hypothetical protein
MIRYNDVTQEVLDLLQEVRAEYFPELRQVKIMVLFDLKKRTHGGKIVLGRCQKSNDLIKHLTIDEANDEEGMVFIIYLDHVAWENIERVDKIRLMRHELRHILLDTESERNPYKLIPHDIEDFAEEIELNQDDVRWASRVCSLTETIYDQQRDQEQG